MAVTRSPWSIGFAGAGTLGAILFVLVALGPLDVVDLVAPGRAGSGGEVMVQDFGAEAIPSGFAYDGQTVYLGARELPDLDAAIAAVPGPEFRLRRILVPLLASMGGTGDTIVLLIAGWGVVGVGLATWGLADLAARNGRDPRLGYAATVALAFPAVIGTTEPLAFGLGFVGLALASRERWAGAVLLLALAALARETAAVMALAVVLDLVLDRRVRLAAVLAVSSLAPLAVWNAVLQSRVTQPPAESTDLFSFLNLPPLDPVDVVVSSMTVVLMVVGIVTWRGTRQLQLVAAGFLACCSFYIGDSYQWHGLSRVSAAAVALGLAGLADLLMQRREPVSAAAQWS